MLGLTASRRIFFVWEGLYLKHREPYPCAIQVHLFFSLRMDNFLDSNGFYLRFGEPLEFVLNGLNTAVFFKMLFKASEALTDWEIWCPETTF